MNIEESYRCNLYNLESVSRYIGRPSEELISIYEDLRADNEFISSLNARISSVRYSSGFEKGIFRMPEVPSVDWFAFERILLYVIIRICKPSFVLETGVFYGGNTVFILKALEDNGTGRLISIDLPDSKIRQTDSHARHPAVGDSELYREDLRPGFLVPPELASRWELVLGDSLDEIPKRAETFDLYVHDSDHSYGFLKREMEAALPKMSASALAVVDDIDWSNAFYEVCAAKRLFPLLLTDNGKDNLRVRIGLLRLDHPSNGVPAITG